jgi:hypothetical protein
VTSKKAKDHFLGIIIAIITYFMNTGRSGKAWYGLCLICDVKSMLGNHNYFENSFHPFEARG